MTNFQNYFTFSNRVQNLLFKGVSVSSNEGLFGICIAVAIVTFLYEAVKSLRHYVVLLQMRRQQDLEFCTTEHKNKELVSSFSDKTSQKLKFHCLQTLLHMLQLAMGYMVMLIVMSFNFWLMLTVVSTTAFCFYFHEFISSRKAPIIPLEMSVSDL